MLPSKKQINEITSSIGLNLTNINSFGKSYAKTLQMWNKSFQNSWPKISNEGFSDKFKRKWEYYFSYCETGFISGSTDVSQFVLQK